MVGTLIKTNFITINVKIVFLGDFNAVQLYLHLKHKMVLLKLSEGHCSIVIMVNKLKLYCYW